MSSENSPIGCSGSLKFHWTRKGGHLYKSIIRATSEESKRVQDKGYYSSIYFKGLLAPVTRPELAHSTSAIAHKLENLDPSSPYYRGLLYKSYSTGCAATTTTTAKHKHLKPSSPYYRGLLFKSCGTGCTITTTTAKHKLNKFNYQVHIPKDCIIDRQLKLSNNM